LAWDSFIIKYQNLSCAELDAAPGVTIATSAFQTSSDAGI
jgi:hypothetical protein